MTERLLRTREVAELLGLTPGTILEYHANGRLPGFRLSAKTLRFRESDVNAYLARCHEGPDEPKLRVVP